MESGAELGDHVLAAAEGLDVLPKLGDRGGQLRQILALELAVGLGVQVVAHATPKPSSASRAPATNVGAVLQ